METVFLTKEGRFMYPLNEFEFRCIVGEDIRLRMSCILQIPFYSLPAEVMMDTRVDCGLLDDTWVLR